MTSLDAHDVASRVSISMGDRERREVETALRLNILGSSAGGGFPQWNCNCRLSRAARAGAAGINQRTQSSLAASADVGATGFSSTRPPTPPTDRANV
jgi:pyrroloquinoline quinone biosynthesis protein B